MNGTNNTPIYDQMMVDQERNESHSFKPGATFFMAPIGTPLEDPGPWQPIGYLSQDWIQLDTGQAEIREWGGDLIRTTTTSFEETFTFKAEKSNRHVLKLVFGVYRLPGDRPLIHKGRKP